jgi:AcrR family transcriptional regulator
MEFKLEETKAKIIGTSVQLFMKHGIKRVTMDDIARELGISKKTIYQHYKDKEEIITTATQIHLDGECNMMKEIRENSSNAVEHLFKLSKIMRESFDNIHSAVLFDLKKYYKSAWLLYQKFEKEVLYKEVENSLYAGIKEGYFRKEINVSVLSSLRILEIQMSFDNELFDHTNNTISEIQHQLLEHFTYGILSEKGLDLFKTYNKQLIHEK